jgi:hypothetical protein
VVEELDEVAASARDHRVVVAGDTKGDPILEQAYSVAVTRPDELRGPVGRVVVHDHDLDGVVVPGEGGVERALDQVAPVADRNADRDQGSGAHQASARKKTSSVSSVQSA